MGKRSDFERVPRDFYPTPPEAVKPLLAVLPSRYRFIEPCAGAGDLIRHMESAGHQCCGAYDVEGHSLPHHLLVTCDARSYQYPAGLPFVTNPPWDRKLLHPIIENLCKQAPTWLLFDADWMHTRQSAPFMPWLAKVVSVGRVKWIPDSKMTGKDNCCWYLFDARHDAPTEFIGR